MKRFHLQRAEDVSGVSGVGKVAEGTEFHDGQVVVSWFGKYHSVEIWPSIEACMAIHGHAGKTVVEWVDK